MSNSSDRRLVPKVRNAPNGSQHQMSRMQSEIDMLSSQLDATQREKDMQRMEISRLRNQLVKLAGMGNMTSLEASNLPTLDDYFQQQGKMDSLVSIDKPQEVMSRPPSTSPKHQSNFAYGSTSGANGVVRDSFDIDMLSVESLRQGPAQGSSSSTGASMEKGKGRQTIVTDERSNKSKSFRTIQVPTG